MLDDWLGGKCFSDDVPASGHVAYLQESAGFPPSSDTVANGPEWKSVLQDLPPESIALLLDSHGPIATSGAVNMTLVHHLHRTLLSRTAVNDLSSSPVSQATAQPVHIHVDSKRSTSGSWKTLGLGNIMDVEWKPILTLGFAGGRSGDSSRSSSPAPEPRVAHPQSDRKERPSDVPTTASEPTRAIPVQAKAKDSESTLSSSPSRWASGLSSSLRSGLGQMGSGLVAGVSPVTNGVGRVLSGRAGSAEVQDGEPVEEAART